MYSRKTRAISVDEIPVHLKQSFAGHVEARQLDTSGSRCWLTHSENLPAPGLMGILFRKRSNPADPNVWHRTVLVLLPKVLLWSTAFEKHPVVTLSAPLSDLRIQTLSPQHQAIAGAGFTLVGFPSPDGAPASIFVGVEANTAGEECILAVQKAIESINH